MNPILNLLQNPVTLGLLTLLIGLLIGSFISMLTWRLPRIMELDGDAQLKAISVSRSKCPHCDTPLPWYRLFPLFSWLATKGKCHACQHKISARYPLIEATTALISLTVVFTFGLSLQTGLGLIFSWFLITICVIDLEHYLILDKLSLPLMWLGLLINTQHIYTSPEDAILGAAFGYLLLWSVFQAFKFITGKEGMGFGDFKLLAALGAWFGVAGLPQIILIAAIASIIVGVSLAILKLRSLQDPIPFGPYLSIGGFITLLYGTQLIQAL